jgi:hypothetical protein
VQKRAKAGLASEGAHRPARGHERPLCEVFGVFPPDARLRDKAVNVRVVRVHQPPDRVVVAVVDGFGQFKVVQTTVPPFASRENRGACGLDG